MSQSPRNLRVMPSRQAKRGPRTLHVIDTAVVPDSVSPIPKKTPLKKRNVPAKQASRNIRTLHVIDTTPPSTSSRAMEASLNSDIVAKQVPPTKPVKGGMSIAKKVVDKAKSYLGQKPTFKDNARRANAKIPFRSRPVRFGKKSDNASMEDNSSSLHASVKVSDMSQTNKKKTTESKAPYIPKQCETKTFVKMDSDIDFRPRNSSYDRRPTRESSKRYSMELEQRYHSRSRERSYVDERKPTVPLRRSSRAHPSSLREDLYFEQRYKPHPHQRPRETRHRDFEWDDKDFRETRQSRQRYRKNSKPVHEEFAKESDNLEDVSDGPLDENDFEEVEVATDEEVEKSNEIPIGFSKCKVRYLGFKRGFFKPKWFNVASERTIINCLTVKGNDSLKAEASVEKAADSIEKDNSTKVSDSTKNVDSRKVGDSIKNIGSTKKADSGKVGDSTKKADSGKVGDSTKKADSAKVGDSTKKADSDKVGNSTKKADSGKVGDSTKKANSIETNDSTKKEDSSEVIVSDKNIDLIEPDKFVQKVVSVETSLANKKIDPVDICSSDKPKSGLTTDLVQEVEMKDSDIPEDFDDKECDDYEVTEDFVDDQLSDSEIIEIEECNNDENSDDSDMPHDMDFEDSDEQSKTDSSDPNKEKTQSDDPSVSLSDSISSKNICSAVSPIKKHKTPDDLHVEDKNTVNKIIPMEVADESKPKSRAYCKSLSKKNEIKDFYQGNAKIQSHLDAWKSHLIGLEYIIEVQDNFTDGNVKKYHCWLCGEDIWCENMVGQTVIGHINGYKHMLDYLAKYFPSCGFKFSESARSYSSEFVLRKCCEEVNNKMGYYFMHITNWDYFSSCKTEIKELFDTLTLPEKEGILDASIHIKDLESLTSSVAESVIKSMLDIISPIQVIQTFISTNNRKGKRYNPCQDVQTLMDSESLAMDGSLEPSRTLIVLTPQSDPPCEPASSPALLTTPTLGPPSTPVPLFDPPCEPASSPALLPTPILGPQSTPVPLFDPPREPASSPALLPTPILGPPSTPVPLFDPPREPASSPALLPTPILGPPSTPVPWFDPPPSRTLIVITPQSDPPREPASSPALLPTSILGPPSTPVPLFGPPSTPVPMFGPPNAPVPMFSPPNPPVQMHSPNPPVPLETPKPMEKGKDSKIPPAKKESNASSLSKDPIVKKCDPKLLTKVNAKQANCLKKYLSLASAFGTIKPSKSAKKNKSSVGNETDDHKTSEEGDQVPIESSILGESKILSFVLEKKTIVVSSGPEDDQKSVDLVLDDKGDLVPPSSIKEEVVSDVIDVPLLKANKKPSVSTKQEKKIKDEENARKLPKAEPTTVEEDDDIIILDENEEETNIPDEEDDKEDSTVLEEDSVAVVDNADSDSIEIIDDDDDENISPIKDEEGEEKVDNSTTKYEPLQEEVASKNENTKQRGSQKSSTHSKYCIKRILNRSTRMIRKRREDTSLDLESISESEDTIPNTSKLRDELHSQDSKLSSTSSKRKRSPSSRSSRSPSLPYNLLRAFSRSRSKSPLRPRRRRSRSPVRSNRFMNKNRSRSPLRRFSRSPLRKKSRSRSRSPVRRRSRSPFRRQSRSPLGRFSRNLPRRRSRSPIKRRSRSPVKRRSRSPVKRRSRSPVKRRSRSPVRRRSRSPNKVSRFQHQDRPRSPYKKFRRSSRSPVRGKSKSPAKRSVSPKRYSPPDFRNSSRTQSSRYEDAGSLKRAMLESLSMSSRSAMQSAHQKSERSRKSELGERSRDSMSNEESEIFAKLKNSQHLAEIMKLPPATRSMVMEIVEKYVGDNKDNDAKVSEFMQIVSRTSSAFQQSIDSGSRKPGQGPLPQEGYYQQQLLSSLAGSSHKPNISYPTSSGIPYPPPSLTRVPQGVPPPFQTQSMPPPLQTQSVPPPQAYPSANIIPSVAPLSYPSINSAPAPQQHMSLQGQQYQPNVSSAIQQNVANLIQQPALAPEMMFKDLKATVSKLFGPKDTNPNLGVFNEASMFSSTLNQPPKQGASKWEPILPSKPAELYSPEPPIQMHATSYTSSYPKHTPPQQQQHFSVPPPDTKVSFCDAPSASNRNLFPVVSKPEAAAAAPSSGNKNSNVSSAKISLAQRLAAVLVKYGMTDVSAALLQEMLMKIGAFSSNPPQDINEREIVDILKRLGYLL